MSALSLWVALVLHAQAGVINECVDHQLGVGTVRYDLAVQMRDSNAQLYNAASFAERELFPAMVYQHDQNKGSGFFVGGVETRQLFNALRMPAQELSDECPYNASMRQQDLYSFAGGFGFGFGPVTGFVASGATASLLTRSGYLRPFMPVIATLGGALLTETAPVWLLVDRDGVVWENGPQGVYLDLIAGAEADLGVAGKARAGVIASDGAYFSYSHPKIGAVFSSAVNLDFANLAYLVAGFQEVKLAKGESHGRTSLYARKLQPDLPDVIAAPGNVSDVWTGHFKQAGIANGAIDLAVAARVLPAPDLQEGWVGVGKRVVREETGSDVRLALGTWNQAPMAYYGLRGGLRPSAMLRFKTWGPGGGFHGAVGLNDPDVLAVYPWAIGSFNLHVGGTFGGGL